MWRPLCKNLRRNAMDKILRHQSRSKHPAAGLHALRKFDLAGAELDGKQRLCVAQCGFGWHQGTPELSSAMCDPRHGL
jgi:hypothetical protein